MTGSARRSAGAAGEGKEGEPSGYGHIRTTRNTFNTPVPEGYGELRSLREIAVPLGYPPQSYCLGRPITPTSPRSPAELDEDDRHGRTLCFQCAKLFSESSSKSTLRGSEMEPGSSRDG